MQQQDELYRQCGTQNTLEVRVLFRSFELIVLCFCIYIYIAGSFEDDNMVMGPWP